MKLEKRLIIIFISLTLIPLMLVSYLGYLSQKEALLKTTSDNLISIVDLQEKRVNEIIDRYLEQVKLIASRTQLRVSTQSFVDSSDLADQQKMNSILKDAKNSVTAISDIYIMDLNGEIIAATDAALIGENHKDKNIFIQGEEGYNLSELFYNENNSLRVRLSGPLFLNDKLIGVVGVSMQASQIIAITEDYTGLGDTGEVILAQKNAAGDAVFITPLRFDSGGALTRAVPKQNKTTPMIPAIYGEEVLLVDDFIVDYRGEPVFAVTRFINSVDWGLVVKVDQIEALRPIKELATSNIFIIGIAIFFILIMSYITAKEVVDPIEDLTIFAQNLKSGSLGMRTEVNSRDEVGFLASTLNDMASQIEGFYKNLELKVKSRTKQLDEAKAKSDAMILSIADGLVATDKNGKIVLVNKAFESILGWSQAQVLGKRLSEVVNMFDDKSKKIPREKRLISKVLDQAKKAVSSRDVYYQKKDKTIFPVSIAVSPILVQGELIGAVEVFRDITHQKEVDKAKTEFVSLASHQLRTPLSTIAWYAEMLLAGDVGILKAEQQDYVEQIYHGNSRMIALVNALLNVSRLELGTFSIEPKEVDVSKVMSQAIDELLPMIQKKKIKVTKKVSKSLPVIQADPQLLMIVFQNLTSNAVKYTPKKGSVKVTIELSKSKKEIEIKISDTGYGIPKDQHDKVFTKLFRADNVKSKDTQGTGLGLYIVKSIVEQSKGKISFESTEDKGTTFDITLPLNGMKKKTGTRRLE